MMRPVPARWFEVLVAHNDAAHALEALAATGAVELELRAGPRASAPLAELKPLLERLGELTGRYQRYWPTPQGHAPGETHSPHETLVHATQQIEHWCEAAEPLIHNLQNLEQETQELDIWHELFTRFRDSDLEFGLLRRPDALLARRLYVFPGDAVFPLPEDVMARRFPLKDQACVLVLGPAETVAALDRQAAALKGRRSGLGMPDWLTARAADNLPRVEQRRVKARAGQAELRAKLDGLSARHGIAAELAEVERLRWFAAEVHVLPSTEYFAWLTGWTSDADGRELRSALAAASVRALLRLPSAPAGAQPPLILRNPWWARPFELFARALGVPARNEVDPSSLLAMVVPVLFGYMFGDVGQGLVLLTAGIVLRRRFALAHLLIAGGIAATVFGFLFGSVFALEHVVLALWLHPLSDPLTVLGVPLLLGALLLMLGLLLAGIEAGWRGEFFRWLAGEAGVLIAYIGALAGLLRPELFWLLAIGLVWSVAGHAWMARRWLAALSGFGAVLEQAFQLAVNTLSFARVGAFALAHAGLSSAVVALAHFTDAAVVSALFLVLGNLVIIVLEGLVVSVQTTRLVLFEFFIRFLRAGGREFHPLSAPHPNP